MTGNNEKEIMKIEDNEKKMNWASIWVAAVILFLISLQFSVYLAALWPYMLQIDPSTDQTFYGVTVAAYSIGSIVTSPFFGYMNKRTKKVRPVVAIGVIFSIAGNIIFMFAEASAYNRKWIILCARFMTGAGRGIAGPIRGYFAVASTPEHKNRAISIGTTALSLGMTAGPLVQMCVVPLSYPGYIYGPLHINEYTAPAYISNVAAIILLVLLYTLFRESEIGDDTKRKDDPYHFIPKYDMLPALVCIFGWFALFFCVTNSEVVESPMTMAVFDWTNDQAVTYNSIIMSVSSFISFLTYLFYIFYGKKINERMSMVIGFFLLFLFYAITFPWPFFTGKLTFKSGPTPVNSTSIYWNSTESTTTMSSGSQVGCDQDMEWCKYTPKLPLLAYLLSYPLLAIGQPAASVSVSTLFSKILGPRQQGVMQSVMNIAGSFSRLLGPILISTLFDLYGPRIAWTITAAVVAACLISVAFYHNRLVPLDTKPIMKSGDKIRYDGGRVYRF